MRIRICRNPVVTGGGMTEWNYRKALEALAGHWLEVETEHLFGDQFNTANLRIFLRNVDAIENDVRPTAAKCGWCGKTTLDVPDSQLHTTCIACDKGKIDRIRPLNDCQGVFYFASEVPKHRIKVVDGREVYNGR